MAWNVVFLMNSNHDYADELILVQWTPEICTLSVSNYMYN